MDLRIEGVGTRLGGRWVLDGVDATPPPGALTGLLGPNGSGKTTLLRIVAGVLAPEAGAVLITPDDDPGSGPNRGSVTDAPSLGALADAGPARPPALPRHAPVPLHDLPRRARARLIALLEQESAAGAPLLVREVVALGRVPYRSWFGADPDPTAVDGAMSAAGVTALADRAWATLSGGERQRVHIARALAQRPSLLLLDEPTNHLDVSAQLALLAFVRGLSTTTVAALHDLNLAASFCDHVLVLSEGRLVAAGAPAHVLTPDLLRDVYHVDADVLTHPRTGRPVIAFTDSRSQGGAEHDETDAATDDAVRDATGTATDDASQGATDRTTEDSTGRGPAVADATQNGGTSG